MQKLFTAILLIAVLLGPLPAALVPVFGQSDTSKIHIGTVHFKCDKATQTPTLLHLMGHARFTSDDYDLAADDIKAYSASGGKTPVSGVQRIVAVGGATPGAQVVAHIRRPLDSESSEIYADRAVYLPDKTRPSGASLTFTGHVKVITKSGFFAEPSLSTTDKAVILLGAGKEYPEIDTGPGDITVTPAQ